VDASAERKSDNTKGALAAADDRYQIQQPD
jgi:hypothetical protein